MNRKDKYYYINRTSFGRNALHTRRLVRWNPNFEVAVDEEVDHYQYINLSINSLNQGDVAKPVSTEYEIVKPVIKETFFDHYILALKYIHETNTDEGEFYSISHSKDWFIIRLYSKDEKNKEQIEIDFRNNVEGLWLSIYATKSHKHRPTSRKNGVAIEPTKFRQFLNLTIQFLRDPDSYLIFLEDYIKGFVLLSEGKDKLESFLNVARKSFENVLSQLTRRKENLEKG